VVAIDTRSVVKRLKEAGFTGYLVKPVRAASLAARLVGGEDGFEHARGEADDTAAAQTGGTNGGLAILVAEDNEINALLAQALLKRLGHCPTVVSSGAAAVDGNRRNSREPAGASPKDGAAPHDQLIDVTKTFATAKPLCAPAPIPRMTPCRNVSISRPASCGPRGITVNALPARGQMPHTWQRIEKRRWTCRDGSCRCWCSDSS